MDPDPDPGGPKTWGFRVWIRIRSEPWLCELLHRWLTEIGTLLPMCLVVFCSILCVLCLLPHNLGPVRLLCPLLRTLLCLAAYSALFSASSSALYYSGGAGALLCSHLCVIFCSVRYCPIIACFLSKNLKSVSCLSPFKFDLCVDPEPGLLTHMNPELILRVSLVQCE
jgi:hypothetical protein